MDEIIQVENQYYIMATSARLNDRVRVLKHGENFAVFEAKGDILPIGHGEQGLYHEGTRYLSRLELRLQDRQPFLLSSTVKEEIPVLSVNLTNPDIAKDGVITLRRNALHVTKCSLLWDNAYHEDLRIRNFELTPVDVNLSLLFDADFADIFEVRGLRRAKRGRLLPPSIDGDGIVLAYEGLDGLQRRLRIRYSPKHGRAEHKSLRYEMTIPPRGEEAIHLTCSFETQSQVSVQPTFRNALGKYRAEIEEARASDTQLSSTNARLNAWMARSTMDLHMMFTRTPVGLYPFAGIPWFSTFFGRDGIITALQYLWINPEPARGVLNYLGATQSEGMIPSQDAEPGKILHESRKGELAALGEIPFGRYYGSVDATPLFVILAGAYYERTGDREFIDGLWPRIRKALDWIDQYGDADGDGFVEYSRKAESGLDNQGWKDSSDAIFHADGRLAEGPIALAEVQAYVYAARLQGALLADLRGETAYAKEHRRRAAALRDRFEREFWCPELNTYGLALDGKKDLCRVRTSNAGHALFGGIAEPYRASTLTDLLLDPSFFSGWGIRTVATSEPRYNPLSYHNGSVWPHDNALIALGISRYEIPKTSLLRIFSALFQASVFTDLHRLPELYCGFEREPGEGPTPYPVACSPQAWASGAFFMLLQASLGLEIDAPGRKLHFKHPALPEWVGELSIRNLRVGDADVDLDVRRHTRDVEINVVNRQGSVRVIVTK